MTLYSLILTVPTQIPQYLKHGVLWTKAKYSISIRTRFYTNEELVIMVQNSDDEEFGIDSEEEFELHDLHESMATSNCHLEIKCQGNW